MSASLAAIRRFLIETFDDEELADFCFDHFPEVYKDFTESMTFGRKVRLLVDYCRRRERAPELLALLKQSRPDSFPPSWVAVASAAGQININTASAGELQRLPGIGPRLAEAIIDGRPYDTVGELSRVNGIGPGRLAAVRERCVA
ncbi:MAG TPA: helix-hairpin-helix domain-containing protein [Promineifilum sp.]|nr:helix-hairpin-helix domain-containing protein [Promineifilum sp.]